MMTLEGKFKLSFLSAVQQIQLQEKKTKTNFGHEVAMTQSELWKVILLFQFLLPLYLPFVSAPPCPSSYLLLFPSTLLAHPCCLEYKAAVRLLRPSPSSPVCNLAR